MGDQGQDFGKKAVSYFEEGSNWAVSVFRSLSEKGHTYETVDPSIATGFGGGLGTNGLVCGALAAGTMIIGLREKGKEKKEVYQQVDRFLGAFKNHFGALTCRELLGVDLKTEEGMHYLKTEGREKCRRFVCYVADTIGKGK